MWASSLGSGTPGKRDPMTDDERYAQWQAWIKRIRGDVQNVLHRRQVFREVWEIIGANPRIQKPSAFYSWMKSVYAAASVMGVRRQVDTDRDAISLRKLILDIRANPGALSRERHIALYPDHLHYLAHRGFDRLAEPGGAYIDGWNVQNDVTRLQKTTHALERFATKRVAHLDPEDPRIAAHVELVELDAALDLLEELVKKYCKLLLAEGGEIVPVIQYDWKAIFQEPWIPPRAAAPQLRAGG